MRKLIKPFLLVISLLLANLQQKIYSTEIQSLTTTSSIGTTLSIPASELRFFINPQNQKTRYSFLLDFNKVMSYPLTIKAGSISFSGGISRLNNPSISKSRSAFSRTSASTGFTASLPNLSGSAKVDSIAFMTVLDTEENYEKVKTGKCFLNCAFTKDLTSIYSFSTSLVLHKIVKLNTDFTFTTFNLSPKESSSWFSEKRNFQSGKYTAGNIALDFSIPFFMNKISFSFYENPFGINRFSLKNESILKTKHLLTNIGFYFSDALFFPNNGKIICPSGNFNSSVFQASLCPQLVFPFNKTQGLRICLLALYSFDFTDDGPILDFTSSAIASVGFELYFSKTTLRLSGKISDICLPNQKQIEELLTYGYIQVPQNQNYPETLPVYSCSFTASRSFSFVQTYFSTAFKYTPNYNPSKNSYFESLSFSLSFKNFPISSLSINATSTQKEGKTSFTGKVSSSISLKTKNIKYMGTIALSIKSQL